MKKIAIIGGGPIGMILASILTSKNIDYIIFESSDHLGGQIINLYPNKKFMDVVGYQNIESHNLVDDLKKKIDKSKVKLNEKVINIIENNNNINIITNINKYEFDYACICIGLGVYTPRPLGLEDENKVDNILYSLKDFSFLKDKKVAIFGGGDSALDWAKEISTLSNNTHLIHRRMEFRGNPDTIKNSTNLKVHLPYVPYKLIIEGNKCKQVIIKNVNDENDLIYIDVDYILVNYGSIPVISNFNFDKQGNFYKVHDNFKLTNQVFALGDCVYYEGKVKRIEPSKKDINLFIDYLTNII